MQDDILSLMQATSPPPDPMMSGMDAAPPVDLMGGSMEAPPVPDLGAGMGMGGASPFPSTDPAMLAQVVADALAQMVDQDMQMLGLQQQQAAIEAQPIIDQMMQQAAAPSMDPMGGMGAPAPDPMMAFGEGTMPPLPPTDMMGM